jgi:hypothetical protein
MLMPMSAIGKPQSALMQSASRQIPTPAADSAKMLFCCVKVAGLPKRATMLDHLRILWAKTEPAQ